MKRRDTKMWTYAMLLDGHVGQMHKHVVQIGEISGIGHRTEPAKAMFVLVRLSPNDSNTHTHTHRQGDYVMNTREERKRSVRGEFGAYLEGFPVGDQHIQAQVKLLPAHQQRILHVTRNDIRVFRRHIRPPTHAHGERARERENKKR